MRRKLVTVVGLLSMLLLGALAAHADTVLCTAKIPFDFTVGKQTLPAGEYMIVRLTWPQPIFEIRNTTSGQARFFFAIVEEPKSEGSSNFSFVFNAYGDTHFLSAVLMGTAEASLYLPKTKHERELTAMGKVPGKIQIAELGR